MNIASNEVLVKSENATNHQKHIEVPRGWNRCLENGSIVYFSPSQICLRSKEEIMRYLMSDRTCKCGLDCPFYIDNVFNFDTSLPSRHFKLTKLENDHKTLCKETTKARFATLAQTQIVIENEMKDVKVNKPVVIKRKLELSVSKKRNETPKLPSFDTFVVADVNSISVLQEEPKPKKPRKPASHKKKPSVSVTSTPSMPKAISSCQTIQTNTTPTMQSSVELQKSVGKDASPKALQYSTVSAGSVFSTSEHPPHPQTVGSTFSFPSTQFNASSFLAALSSATTIPGQTRAVEASHAQKVHPLRPFTTKSSVEHAPFTQKPAGFPGVPNQPNNVVYISSTGGLHPVPNLNSKVNWPGTSGVTLPRLPQEKADKPSLEPSKGFFSVRGKESLPRMVYPYPSPVANVKSTMCTNTVSSGTSKVQIKPQDLTQVVQNQQNVKSSILGRSETPLPGHSITKMANTDKHSNAKTATKPPDPLSQPLQYCGILLQPGVVPQVQLTSTGTRPSVGASNTQEQQNPYGNLYTLQGLPYGGNVANPAVLGMAPNTVIPYFLGIAQPGNVPKPIVPAAGSTSTTKESSPTSSAAPVSTSAIAAAYSAFVSIAPASVTNSSFSQQLVNLVSNYNNPYWQHLLTQGASANALAYQFMQIGQYTNPRSGLSTQTAKSSSGKSSSHTPTKVTTSSPRSSISTSQESKPKITTKDSVSVPAAAVVTSSTFTVPSTVTASSVINNAGGQENERKLLECIAATNKPSLSNTVGACAGSNSSSNKFSKEKSSSIISETSASTNDNFTAKLASTSAVLSNKDSNTTDRYCSTKNGTVTSSNGNLGEKMDCTSIKTVDSMVDNSHEKRSSSSVGRIASSYDISVEESVCTDSTDDNLKEKVTDNNSKTLASKSDNSEESTSTSNEAIVSIKDNPTEESVSNSSETLSKIDDITMEESDSNEKHGTSNDILAEKNTGSGIAKDTLPKDSAETTSEERCEKKLGVTNAVNVNSIAEVCKGNATNDDDMTTNSVPPGEVSRNSLTSDITEDCSKSTTENVNMSSVPIDADSLNDNGYKLEVSMCSLKDNAATSELDSTIPECEEVKTDNIDNKCLNVTADSEEPSNDCKNVANDAEDVRNECSTTDSTCEKNRSSKNDNIDNDKVNDNILLGDKRKIGQEVKTDLNNDTDVKSDLIKDIKMKTESLEKRDNKTNSLEDLAQVPVKTEETSKRRSSKINCDQDVKKVKKENVMSVESEVQKDKSESMTNDTESSKEALNKEKEVFETPVEFTIGDIVWAQARGLPSWPGKIVDERDVGHGKAAADIGKKWVMWFGDHTFSQVEVEKLKTLTDGLKTLDDKGRKRKHRGKKTRIGLEQAISEALEELDQRDRLRSRQGPKAKKRRF